MMKVFFWPLFLLAWCVLGTACSDDQSSGASHLNGLADKSPDGKMTKINKYLYAVEFDDYDFEASVRQHNEKYGLANSGCSEVRKGNFVGRNLDWYINREPSIVIKVNGNKRRLASIGMVGVIPKMTLDVVAKGVSDELYETLPLNTVDGVNAKGVYVGVNVMPTGETSLDSSRWRSGEWGLGAAYTNPENKDSTYDVVHLVRFVLDNALSVEDAKRRINRVNWYESKNNLDTRHSQSLHWLIADSSKTVVLEFLDNEPQYTESSKINEPSYATIMTNFTNKVMKKGLVQPHGTGYERYDLLKDQYDTLSETFGGFEQMMKSVWFSQTYTKKLKSPDFFFTEYAGETFTANELYGNSKIWNRQEFYDLATKAQKMFQDTSYWYRSDSPLWFTTFTSLYDLKNRAMRVLVHEGRDGQRAYFEADLDSRFEKPLD